MRSSPWAGSSFKNPAPEVNAPRVQVPTIMFKLSQKRHYHSYSPKSLVFSCCVLGPCEVGCRRGDRARRASRLGRMRLEKRL